MEFFDWLGKQLEYKHMEDWYKVSKEDFAQHGGKQLLHVFYHDSPSKALQSVYPEHNWLMWRFHTTPRGYWKAILQNIDEQRVIIDWMSKQLCIKRLEDWYTVSFQRVANLVPMERKALPQMLEIVYPQHKWNKDKLMESKDR